MIQQPVANTVYPHGIRPAVTEDAEQLAEVYVQTLRDAYGGVMPSGFVDPVNVVQRTIRFREALTTGRRTWLVSVQANAVVGFCGLSKAQGQDVLEDVGEINVVAVAQQHRRKGHGTRLLAAASAEAVRCGWHTLIVWVVAKNSTAQALYAQNGFRPDGATTLDNRLGFSAELVRFRAVLK